MAKEEHLYRYGAAPRMRRKFEREYEDKGYSKERADKIFGATVGNVKREREELAGRACNCRHSRGDHPGPCSRACRRGEVTHYHRR